MSKATKRKHVIKELLNSEIKLPDENEVLCRIIKSCGNNLHEVEDSGSEIFLASMPSKFRRNVWVKRGDFVLLEQIKEGNKVKGEIINVLTRDHIKYYKSHGVWPDKFDDSSNKLDDNYDPSRSDDFGAKLSDGNISNSVSSDSDDSSDDNDNGQLT